jgi:hypothetical protein
VDSVFASLSTQTCTALVSVTVGSGIQRFVWAKVVELLAVNRLCEPRSQLFVHEKWFPQTALDLLLDCPAAVAEKDRLYRALDRMVAHKAAWEQPLAEKWRDLFGASFDVLLYDLTSTCFEGGAEEVDQAARGYWRDHWLDWSQVVIAIVVTPEGVPLSYEVFDGDRADVTTLEAMLDQVEAKHGRARRIWVFDRGIGSEAHLQRLRFSIFRVWMQNLLSTNRHQYVIGRRVTYVAEGRPVPPPP